MAVKDGKPLMAFGTPGGDVQIQAMAQVFMNTYVFGMDIQSAIEAPRFATYSFPSSFAPNTYHPGLLMMEQSIPGDVFADLAARGHKTEVWPDGIWKAGGVLAVRQDPATGTKMARGRPTSRGELHKAYDMSDTDPETTHMDTLSAYALTVATASIATKSAKPRNMLRL